MNLVKSFGVVFGILVISLIIFQGCTSSTGSTSSGSGSISRIQVLPAASSLQASQRSTVTDPVTGTTDYTYTWSSTFITVIVKDSNGNFVPAGTPVTIACGAGYIGDIPDPENPASSITVTTDSNGQVQVKYTAGFTKGTASISAISQGNYGSATITIV